MSPIMLSISIQSFERSALYQTLYQILLEGYTVLKRDGLTNVLT